MAKTNQDQRYQGFDRRMKTLGIAVVVVFAVLVGKLWYLQIIHGEHYASQATHLRLDWHDLDAPRGMIYGRDKSTVLADTRPSRDCVIIPARCEDQEETVVRRLARLLDVDPEALLEQVRAIQDSSKPYTQVEVKHNISKTELTRVEEFSPALPGVITLVRPQRRYLHGKVGGQLLGYVGPIYEEEWETLRLESDYRRNNQIGKAGLELAYEDLLRGRDGQLCVSKYASGERQLRYDDLGNEYIVMDVLGRRLREEEQFRRDPVPGKPLYTTLDIGLQRKAEELLDGYFMAPDERDGPESAHRKTGAIVVLNAETGEVLAMASSPGYDPSVFVSGRSGERTGLLQDPGKPMRSRAYREQYPPGSVFKVMLAIAALEEGVITETTTHYCDGRFRLPGVNRPWRCWRLKYGGHGETSIVDALAFSCDVFFYHVGRDLGVDRIKEWASRLGLGEITGLDLPGETAGIVPSREWKEAVGRRLHPGTPSEWRWYPGETINLSIGQGDVATTPLQNAVLMAAVVNGGRRIRPHLNLLEDSMPSDCFISDKTLDLVCRGMRKCVEKDDYPRGTGIEAKIPGMIVLGKTGTAQAVGRSHYEDYDDEKLIPYALRDHALFVAGVLDREPRIAVSVIVEHGLHGGSEAAPLARAIIEFFYDHQPESVMVARSSDTP